MSGRPSELRLIERGSSTASFRTSSVPNLPLAVSAYPSLMSTLASQPKPAAVLSASRRIASQIVLKTVGLRSRIVPASLAVSGITFVASPAWNMVTDTTAFVALGSVRATIVCRANTSAAAHGTGSRQALGALPWPPRPARRWHRDAGVGLARGLASR